MLEELVPDHDRTTLHHHLEECLLGLVHETENDLVRLDAGKLLRLRLANLCLPQHPRPQQSHGRMHISHSADIP